jgi:hypothetical protein
MDTAAGKFADYLDRARLPNEPIYRKVAALIARSGVLRGKNG